MITRTILAYIVMSTTVSASTWETRFGEDSDGPVCFLYAHPMEAATLSKSRPLPIANIAVESFEPLITEFSTVLYLPKTFKSFGHIEVNGKMFKIIIQDGNGWIRYKELETSLLNELRTATHFSIAYTDDGVVKTDRYSVSDFPNKIEELRRKCNIAS